ncbi:MAG: hypothetical protein Q8N06_00775 [Hydrogenophaga sp.]|nr:hypothetical protein [Hydrogenophaga sp.]
MSPQEAYANLEPYLLEEINYSNEEETISQHDKFANSIEQSFYQQFKFRIKVQSPFNYTKSFSISIGLDEQGLPSDANVFLTTLYISAKGPFCTFDCFKKARPDDLSSGNSIKWIPIPPNDLAKIVTPWIDWLCQRYPLTYIPCDLLQQQVDGQETQLSCAPATLFTMMFSEI